MTNSFSYPLKHFLATQDAFYPQVLLELERGKKQTHWMWFIFPQLLGLGTSSQAVRYAISDLAHAKAYLADPLLGARLKKCATLLEMHPNKTAQQIFGTPDDLKLHSSLTLFALASEKPSVFHRLLDQFFDGKMDVRTLKNLNEPEK